MTKRDVLSVALKVVGIILLIYAVVGIPRTVIYVILMLSRRVPGLLHHTLEAWLQVAAAALFIILAGMLIGFADGIARKLVREDRELSIPRVDERPLFGVALRVIGVVLVVQAIPEVLRLLAEPALQVKHGTGTLGWQLYKEFWTKHWVAHWAQTIQCAASLLLGLYLVAGARQFVDLLYRERPVAAEADESA